jgi:hypothetical protein
MLSIGAGVVVIGIFKNMLKTASGTGVYEKWRFLADLFCSLSQFNDFLS